tara:strand:- start:2534 stop:3121 length:588 start_codon:yes stop_codon:yes gene_type:complete
MDNFDLRKYLAEGRLLKEELTYTFSEYDYDINDDAYQAEVEAGIKAKHPEISDEDLEAIIDSSVEYYYDEARDENKRGRDADPTPSSDIVSMAIDYYEDEFLAEGKLLKENLNLDIEDDIAILSGDSGEYEGEIEDGKVSFSVMYDDLDYRISDQYDENNIEDFLGKGHAFVELAKKYDHNWDIERDLVGITIKL